MNKNNHLLFNKNFSFSTFSRGNSSARMLFNLVNLTLDPWSLYGVSFTLSKQKENKDANKYSTS